MDRDCADRRFREDESGEGCGLPTDIQEFLSKQPLVRFVVPSVPLNGIDRELGNVFPCQL
jgi:hypothetical protein